MAVRSLLSLLQRQILATQTSRCIPQTTSISYKLGKKVESWDQTQKMPSVMNALPTSHLTTKVIFDNQRTAEFKNVWLRDNCSCPMCVDGLTRQKLFDTPSLDIYVKPSSLKVTDDGGNLIVCWRENGQDHISTFGSIWLYRYGQSFMQDTCGTTTTDAHDFWPPLILWDEDEIWRQLPVISYKEFMESNDGLKKWLKMIYTYGIAIMRQVPTKQDQIIDVVSRFGYVKETQYGVTFDVVNEPDPTAHPAFSGVYLHHHTDMNYLEKSPGIQLLHCLKSSGETAGGMSFFVDGFRVAKWLQTNEAAAFHILNSTPVRFQIQNRGKYYSQLWPVICTNQDGDLTEIHYNNRTMGPLQAPSHIVVPFYHAYKLFSEKVREETSELRINLTPGDLVAFNNRRILHGRTSFDPTKVTRHLVGCYADTDEVVSILNSLLNES